MNDSETIGRIERRLLDEPEPRCHTPRLCKDEGRHVCGIKR